MLIRPEKKIRLWSLDQTSRARCNTRGPAEIPNPLGKNKQDEQAEMSSVTLGGQKLNRLVQLAPGPLTANCQISPPLYTNHVQGEGPGASACEADGQRCQLILSDEVCSRTVLAVGIRPGYHDMTKLGIH